jgi:hypothetical protein
VPLQHALIMAILRKHSVSVDRQRNEFDEKRDCWARRVHVVPFDESGQATAMTPASVKPLQPSKRSTARCSTDGAAPIRSGQAGPARYRRLVLRCVIELRFKTGAATKQRDAGSRWLRWLRQAGKRRNYPTSLMVG